MLNFTRSDAKQASGSSVQQALHLATEAVGFVTHGRAKFTDISRRVPPFTPDCSQWMRFQRQLGEMQARLAK